MKYVSSLRYVGITKRKMSKSSSVNNKISIIVPIYNCQSYLKRCFDSIRLQVYCDFEVICVNDGSTDCSGDICVNYQMIDKRFKVFHTENLGVSHARNYALSKVEGAWFCFVDADDWIEPNYLEELYKLAIQNECDVAACSYHKEKKILYKRPNKEKKCWVFNSAQDCIHNFICDNNSMHGMVWNKLYSTERFRHIRFRVDIRINEDCLYTYAVMQMCRKACLTTQQLYHWVMRKDSACHGKTGVGDFHSANVFIEMIRLIELQDDMEMTRTLQRNYVMAVVRIFNNTKYEMMDMKVVDAKKRCKLWRRQVWPYMNIRNRLEYIRAFYNINTFIRK